MVSNERMEILEKKIRKIPEIANKVYEIIVWKLKETYENNKMLITDIITKLE